MKVFELRVAIAAVMLLTLPAAVEAQTRIPPAFIGTWTGPGNTPPSGAPAAELVYRDLDKNLGRYLQPWAMARHDATEWNIDDTGQVCKLAGIFRPGHATGMAPFRFAEAPGKLYQIWGLDEHGLQRIYFDSEHPKNLPYTWNGHSIGHFEGDDTLVVDTIGFNEKSWLSSDRWPHTEELHVIERYRLFGNGAYIQLRVFVDDRKALTEPYTYTRYYRRAAEPTEGGEALCNETAPGENLWQIRRDELLAEHKAKLDVFVAKYASEPLPIVTNAPGPPVVLSVIPADAARLAALRGVYEIVPFATTLAGGLKGTGPLADLPLLPAAMQKARSADLRLDAAKNCQPLGPFRMMARDGTRFEMLVAANRITMMFENIALGHKREIYLGRKEHSTKLEPNLLGDSIGHWEGETLVVDTTRFNEMTWLNDAGAPHSDALHVVERYRLVQGGNYLELQVTAADSKTLTKPYSYTRYYQKSNRELSEDFCEDGNKEGTER